MRFNIAPKVDHAPESLHLNRWQGLQRAARAAGRVLPRRHWDILTPSGASSGDRSGGWAACTLRTSTALGCVLVRQSRDPTTPAGTSARGCWCGSCGRSAAAVRASSALGRVLLGCARHVLTPGGATLSRSDWTVRSHCRGSTGAAVAARSVLPRCMRDPSAPVHANARACSIHWPATVWSHGSISSRAATTFGGVLP